MPGRVIPALQGPLGPGGMGDLTGSRDHLRPEGAVRETEFLLEEAVRGISAHRLPSRPRRQSPAGPADRACWEYTKTGKCQYGRECRFTTRAQGTPLRPLRRGLAIGPLGTSLCSSDIATTGCMANAQLSRAGTCIRSHHQARSPLRLVPLLVRLLRMKRGIPLDRLRPVLPIGRGGVSTAPLKD